MPTWTELQQATAGWDACLHVIRHFSDHYALDEEQQSYVYRYAMQVPAGGVAVELGICNGKTAAVLAYCARKRGYEAHGVDAFILENSAPALRDTFARLDLPITIHHALTSSAPIPGYALAPVAWTRPVDLLLIDGSHTDPWAAADFAEWIPRVRPGGVAMFHDYDGKNDPSSAHYAVRVAAEKHTAHWGTEYYVNGLMIRRAPLEVLQS